MPTAGVLADASVEVRALIAPFQQAMVGVRAQLSALTGHPYLVRIGFSAFGALDRAVRLFSDLTESVNKTQVVFGAASRVVEDGADAMAAKFGIVKTEYHDAAGEIGQLLIGMGRMGEEEAARLSVALTKAAADSSSLFNRSFAESTEKVAAAIRGMSRPIASYGVDVQEAAVKAEAARQAGGRLNRELTTQEKVGARAALVIRGLKVAQGDLANTQTQIANATRENEGRAVNLAAAIGEQLAPAYSAFRALINEVLVDFTTSHDGMTSALQAAVGWIRSGIETLGVIYRNWGLIVQRTTVMIGGWMANVVETVLWLKDVLLAFLDWFGTNWRSIFRDAFNFVATAIQNLAQNFLDFGRAIKDWFESGFNRPFTFKMTPVLEGFKAETPDLKVPKLALSDVADQLAEIDDKMAKVEEKHAAGKVAGAPGKRPGREVPGEVEGKEPKLRILDLAEFAKKIQEGAFGKDAAAKTADNTRRLVALQEANNKLQEKMLRKPAPNAVVGPT